MTQDAQCADPLPWQLIEGRNIYDAKGGYIGTIDDCSSAARIIDAVNSVDALRAEVASLKAERDTLQSKIAEMTEDHITHDEQMRLVWCTVVALKEERAQWLIERAQWRKGLRRTELRVCDGGYIIVRGKEISRRRRKWWRAQGCKIVHVITRPKVASK